MAMESVATLMSDVTHPCHWVNVLVDYGGQPDIYTYAVPANLAVGVGDILNVPFGQQVLGAIALQLLGTPPANLAAEQIRPVAGVVERRFFSPAYWQLLQTVASYYQTPLIQVVKAALPPGLLAKSQRRLRLCPEQIPAYIDDRVAPQVAQLVKALRQSATGDYTWQYLQRRGLGNYRTLQQLVQLGWAESYLAPPQSPNPKLRQAVIVTSGNGQHCDQLTSRQTEILATLQRQGGELWLSDALQVCKTTSATLKRLAQSGCVVIEPREVLRTEAGPRQVADQPKPLTPAQAQALDQINQSHRARQILLHGVTGSGKTEVYLQAIAPRLAQGQSALVLVPEIGLTPQLTDRFRRRFGDQVWVYHSGLADGERYDTWRSSLQKSRPMVVVGTRSAIFLPLPNLGIIILDEEHDSSYKQDVPPCYHARTVAQWRARLEDCPLVLGSATPSLETWVQCRPPVLEQSSRDQQNAEQKGTLLDKARSNHSAHRPSSDDDRSADHHPSALDIGDPQHLQPLQPVDSAISIDKPTPLTAAASHRRLPDQQSQNQIPSAIAQPGQGQPTDPHGCNLPTVYLSLPERVQARPFPTVEVVDMRQELQLGNRSIFSRRLQTALQTMKDQGNQGLLFIHRRGHSSFVSCRSCGHVMMCPHCDVSLSYHQPHQHSAMTLRCHYCGFMQGHPRHCPECGSPYLKHFGSGTQRVVSALGEHFPELRCIRFDSDTTRTKGAHRALLARFASGEADLLVGTQMLTKGIDLPQVTVVGIIAADGLLYMSDYWASERALQMLIQVAGRAGRGDQPGEVILQTYTPEHPVIEAVQQHRYDGFIASEWEQRQLLQYPPAGRLILLRLSSLEPQLVQQTAGQLASHLQSLLADSPHDLLGPAPAPIVKVARRYRWHMLLKFALGQPLPDLTHLKNLCPTKVSLTIDVDPLNLG
jgi:primosomal protein N' (replication factor Y)